MSLARQVFDAAEPDSPGQRVQGIVFELAVLRGVFDDLYVWTAILPTLPGVLAPQGLGRVADVSFLFNAQWARSNALLTGALVLLGFFRVWRGAYLVALLTYHLHYAARYSVGKTGHASNALGFALLALGAAHIAYRDPTLRRRAAYAFTWLLLSIGYSWAAACKLSTMGVRWADGHHLWLWIRQKWVDTASLTGARHANQLQKWATGSLGFSTLILSFGLLTEAASSLMLVRRARRYVLLALAAMHIGILYTMNIAFMNNIYLLLAMGLPIAECFDRYQALRRPAHLAQQASE